MSISNLKYFGFYRGIVKQCLNNGYCRIRIPDILEPLENDITTLPPAEPAQPIGGGGNTDNGNFMYPEIESTVWCFFDGGNLERPVYFATSNGSSTSWANVVKLQKPNQNKGNAGVSVFPAGSISKYNRTSIEQTSMIDENTGENLSDSIEIKVDSIPKINKAVNVQNTDEENGYFVLPAASIKLENKGNTLVLSAKNEIILKAPKITLSSAGNGVYENGITINAHDFDMLSNNGHFRVLNANVNIDGGLENQIFLQSGDKIHIITLEKIENEDGTTVINKNSSTI